MSTSGGSTSKGTPEAKNGLGGKRVTATQAVAASKTKTVVKPTSRKGLKRVLDRLSATR